MVECRCFTPTEAVGLLGTGAQDDHLDFHTAHELCKPYGFCGRYASTYLVLYLPHMEIKSRRPSILLEAGPVQLVETLL